MNGTASLRVSPFDFGNLMSRSCCFQSFFLPFWSQNLDWNGNETLFQRIYHNSFTYLPPFLNRASPQQHRNIRNPNQTSKCDHRQQSPLNRNNRWRWTVSIQLFWCTMLKHNQICDPSLVTTTLTQANSHTWISPAQRTTSNTTKINESRIRNTHPAKQKTKTNVQKNLELLTLSAAAGTLWKNVSYFVSGFLSEDTSLWFLTCYNLNCTIYDKFQSNLYRTPSHTRKKRGVPPPNARNFSVARASTQPWFCFCVQTSVILEFVWNHMENPA